VPSAETVTDAPDPRALARLHLDALYECDASGAIVASRDPDVMPPRFHLMRTRAGNVWLLRAGLEATQVDALRAVLAAQPHVADGADAERRPPDLSAIRAVLGAHAPVVGEYSGPASCFPSHLSTAGRVEILTDRGRAPRTGAFAWLREARPTADPIALVRSASGEVVSVCFSARSSAKAAEAGVETAPEYRRQGFGAAAVLAWALTIRREGRTPFYSAEWTNAASRRLASRLGLIWYGEDLHIG
jgi:RimJ/RimL family protein N-acetyltransferase